MLKYNLNKRKSSLETIGNLIKCVHALATLSFVEMGQKDSVVNDLSELQKSILKTRLA